MDIPDILKQRYLWIKEHTAREDSRGFALEILAEDRIGLLADISSAAASLGCNLSFIQSWMEHNRSIHILIQVDQENLKTPLEKALKKVASVKRISVRPTYRETYGKRIIIMGGGAQVAQAASGAIAEADRHNIRGEKISVDTIAIIGEPEIAQAVRAVGRLHRAAIVVLAGALMGGEISRAVNELRTGYGIPVMSLKMAGSVNEVSDLVVTDPTAAGVMAVMLVSHIGQFNLLDIHGKEY